jgi:hypothetical protein
MPTFSELGLSGDPVRVAEQIDVTVPFYSGMAYSLGALLTKHKVIDRIVSSLRRLPGPEVFEQEGAEVECVADAEKSPAHEGK